MFSLPLLRLIVHEVGVWARIQTRDWGLDTSPREDLPTLRERVSADSKDAGLIGRLAAAELAEGNVEQAVAAAGEALRLDPAQRHALTALGTIMAGAAREAGSDADRQAYDDDAQPLLKKLNAVDPPACTALSYLRSVCASSS